MKTVWAYRIDHPVTPYVRFGNSKRAILKSLQTKWMSLAFAEMLGICPTDIETPTKFVIREVR
jgi:hypothetical protein